MPIDTPHPDYLRWAMHWQKMRDAVLGQEAMERATVGARLPTELPRSWVGRDYYLPRLGGQSDEQYAAYVRRASFYGATARTIDALVGAVFRRAPVIDASEEMVDQLEDVDLSGTPFDVFAQQCLREELTTGNVGILVDYPPDGASRPYWARYAVEDILACAAERIAGTEMLTQVRLHECRWEERGDFEYQKVEIIRHLDLDETGYYRQRVYTQTAETAGWVMTEEFLPTRRGERLAFIPFSCEWPLRRPPLLDLADVNLAHYRKAADYAHGLHFTALPTPWLSDREIPTGAAFKIGSETAWTLSDVGSCGMLEFSGAGMSAIKDAMLDDETRMAHLGAELLAPDKRAIEAADALRMRSNAKTASLAALANRLSWRLTKAAQMHAWWIGESDAAVEEVSISLNTEFAESHLDPAELTAWVAARQAGEVTRRMFLDRLAKFEALGEQTIDEALVELEAENDLAAERDQLRAEAQRFKQVSGVMMDQMGAKDDGEAA